MSSFLTAVGALMALAYFWPEGQGKVVSSSSSSPPSPPSRRRKRKRR